MSRNQVLTAGPAYGIIGMGMYVPETVVTSAEIADGLGVDVDWIVTKTGIVERRRANAEESTSTMAAAAVATTLENARERADFESDPEMLIMSTSTPDRLVPAPVYDLHALSGLPTIPCLSIDGACAGVAQAMITALGFYRTGIASSAVVVGSQRTELVCDGTDRKTAALFGDGAGAYLLGPVPDGYGILAAQMLTDSEHRNAISTPPLLDDGWRGKLIMHGRELVETFACELPKMIYETLGSAGLTMADVDRVIVHQGNVRMVEAFTQLLGLRAEQVPVSGDLFGNTTSASLPMTTVLTDRERPLERGEVVVLATAGAGVNGAVIVMRWY